MRRLWPIPLFLALSIFATRPAHAQHFDASFNAGVSKRILSGGSLSGSTGPIVGLAGDVALMPLIRVGAYVDEEMAFDGEPKAPFITSFGARVKFLPPLGNEKLRAWIFVGFGYAFLSAPGYHESLPLPSGSGTQVSQDATTPASGGTFIEIPFGVGGSYQLRAPWVLLAELSGRAGLNSSGNYFDPTGRNAFQTSAPTNNIGLITGNESFAIILTVGIGLDL
jgi:hypothetical protein